MSKLMTTSLGENTTCLDGAVVNNNLDFDVEQYVDEDTGEVIEIRKPWTIIIATTNLTCNPDSAFERRFLFKVEFQKPSVEVKAKLWSSMLGEGSGRAAALTEADAHRLAMRYDFSGGQIENIARKCTVEYILSGKKAGYDEIDEFCQHELLDNRGAMKPIGFKCA